MRWRPPGGRATRAGNPREARPAACASVPGAVASPGCEPPPSQPHGSPQSLPSPAHRRVRLQQSRLAERCQRAGGGRKAPSRLPGGRSAARAGSPPGVSSSTAAAARHLLRSPGRQPARPASTRRAAWSDAQLRAALSTAGGKDSTPAPGPHPQPEAVDLGPPAVVRLERTLAHWSSTSAIRDLLEIQRGQPVNGMGDTGTGQTGPSRPAMPARPSSGRARPGLPSWNTAVSPAHPAPAT